MAHGTSADKAFNPHLVESTLPTLEEIAAWKAKLPETRFDGQVYWVAEGDLVLDEPALASYVAGRLRPKSLPKLMKPMHLPSELRWWKRDPSVRGTFLEQPDGGLVRWSPGTILSYTIDRDTFHGKIDTEAVDQLTTDLATAAADWESACNVKFQRIDDDVAAAPLFRVVFGDADDVLYAHSFFPETPANRRYLAIMARYFEKDPVLRRVGLLRHELGHILGFRHENIRPEEKAPDCPKERTAQDPGALGIVAMSPFDSQSVMHYFCGAQRNWAMELTKDDRDSARKVYGAPIDDP